MPEHEPPPPARGFAAPCLAALLLLAATAPSARAQDMAFLTGDSKSVRIQRVNEAPDIDGRLDDAVWLRAPVVDDLHQVNPNEYAAPSELTEVMLLYDRNNLYVGVRMYDREPERINARILRQNENINSDDRFFLQIDSFSNRRSGYLFGVNPNGVRYDGIFQNITSRNFDWDGIWQAEASIDELGWVLEIAIPFETLSFDPNNDTWRMNFIRNIERRNETIAWASRNRQTDLSTMGNVRGISQIEQGMGLDVVPSLSFQDRKDYSGAPTDSATEPSLDVFYKVTPSLNASLTINTDFSATEVDNRQVNLTRFSLFFPERRDFFLKDVDIFQFGGLSQNGSPFFSRSIGISQTGAAVPLNYGGKLSGRVGRFDVGALAVRQDEFSSTDFLGRPRNVDATTALVGRVAANVLRESSVGMIVTSGDPQSNLDNSVIGTDFRYVNSRLAGGRSIEAEAWIQQSDTPGIDDDDVAAGFAFRMPSSEGFRGGIDAKRIEIGFNPAMGFVNRRGILEENAFFGYLWRPRGGAIRSYAATTDFSRFEFLDNGEIQSQNVGIGGEVQLNSQDNFGLSFSQVKEGIRVPFEISPGIVIDPGLYTFYTSNLRIFTGGQRKYAMGLFVNDGEFYDGTRSGFGGFFGFRPSRHFRANLNYQLNDISLPDGSFETKLYRLQLEAIFTSKISWVNLIQYDNVSDTLGINSRVHWIPQAGREAFLVINHNLEDYDGDGDFKSYLAEVAVKFSYTFRF